ncbi:MAG: ABC-2 family transporter protein [Anaerolineales bacterium]|nr:ABC-2 family transporter protein [Anaerolineales bacterium]
MLQTLQLYRRLIGVQIRSQMQYRLSFFVEIAGTGLIALLEYASLALVFARFETLKGWTLGQVAFIFGLAELSFGVMDLFFSGFDPGYFGQFVRRGRFDQLLLRPINITLQVLGSKFMLRRIGKIAVGVGIVVSAVGMNPIDWTPLKVLLTGTVVVSQVAFFGGLFIIGATISFWTVESIEAINIFTYGGSMMISHPMHIFPTILRNFFTFIVPAIFLNYYPALYILELPDPFNMPAFAPFLAPLAGLWMLFMALVIWRFGIRHYQSTGT